MAILIEVFLFLIGLIPLQYHLTPRVRGMELLLKNMSSHLHAVYDVTVVYADENGGCLDKGKPMPGLLCKSHIGSTFTKEGRWLQWNGSICFTLMFSLHIYHSLALRSSPNLR